MASFSMFGSLGAAVQVLLILYPFIPFTYECVRTDLARHTHWTLTPWYLTSVWCWVLLFTFIHFKKCSITASILVFFPVLSLKWVSAIWWCPQWWASIALLSSLASCLEHRTPTSHRYLTANLLHGSCLTVRYNQKLVMFCVYSL